jgi:restriction system protein
VRGKYANTFVRFIDTIQIGDYVFIDNGKQAYDIFEVSGNYYFAQDNIPLPHRRGVNYIRTIEKNKFPDRIVNSFGNVNTLTSINSIEEENMIRAVLQGKISESNLLKDIIQEEERQSFLLEKHLESFIVGNWSSIKDLDGYSVYEEDGEKVGQQYDTEEVGIIDILAINEKTKKLLVIEIKRRTTDEVVGQILRYIGYVKKNIAAQLGYEVEGLIVSEKLPENYKLRIDYALDLLPTIKHKSYSIKFDLE